MDEFVAGQKVVFTGDTTNTEYTVIGVKGTFVRMRDPDGKVTMAHSSLVEPAIKQEAPAEQPTVTEAAVASVKQEEQPSSAEVHVQEQAPVATMEELKDEGYEYKIPAGASVKVRLCISYIQSSESCKLLGHVSQDYNEVYRIKSHWSGPLMTNTPVIWHGLQWVWCGSRVDRVPGEVERYTTSVLLVRKDIGIVEVLINGADPLAELIPMRAASFMAIADSLF